MPRRSSTPKEHRDTWQTPPELFQALNSEFHFRLDAAASEENALCERFITAEQDTLTTEWSDYLTCGYVWLNPPYSNPAPFIAKAAREKALHHIGCVMLLPSDTSTGWFKSAIGSASEVRFITAGRLSFVSSQTGKPVDGNNKGSILIIWHPWPAENCNFSTVDKNQLLSFGTLNKCTVCGTLSEDSGWCDACDAVYSANDPNFSDAGGDNGKK